ncbi:MAG: hypothetical protein ACK55Z_32950 [bacterium]
MSKVGNVVGDGIGDELPLQRAPPPPPFSCDLSSYSCHLYPLYRPPMLPTLVTLTPYPCYPG